MNIRKRRRQQWRRAYWQRANLRLCRRFQRSFLQALRGRTYPIEQLWEGLFD